MRLERVVSVHGDQSSDPAERGPKWWTTLRRQDDPGHRGLAAVTEQACDSEDSNCRHEEDPFPTHGGYRSPSDDFVHEIVDDLLDLLRVVVIIHGGSVVGVRDVPR